MSWTDSSPLRSLVTRPDQQGIYRNPHTDRRLPHGCLRLGGSMNDQAPESPLFSFRPFFPTFPPPANMSQTDDQANRLSEPAAQQHPTSNLLPAPDYATIFRKYHHHTISDSTNTAGSNDSSPTTTISTVDDSSATEPSPGSSPESPPPTTFAVGMLRPRTADETTSSFFELQKQPPPKKGRNLKNLAVNTSRNPVRGASTSSLPPANPADPSVSILSPTFVKPPTPQKRKPNNLGLTILTPGAGSVAPQEVKLTIPPTPAFGRPATLRHFQSSPSLPLVPGIGLPSKPSNRELQRLQALDTIFSPIQAPDITRPTDGDDEQNFDLPLSREEKPEAYPDGPICVYDPHIDLYLEPTVEEARKYDVIMNVASEVRNPFRSYSEPTAQETDLRLDGGGGIQYAPKRNLLSAQPSDPWTASSRDASPTTPKATPLIPAFPKDGPSNGPPQEPEYIHIPWDHNSDIVPDLLRLVKLIDEKVTQGKRVLVHCQCGVSRSASLVVAYGLYKCPSMSVQEAYDAVKQKSKWIGPNMNLIMQLQEFRSSLARGGVLNRSMNDMTPSSAKSDWAGPFSDRHPLSAVLPPPPSAEVKHSADFVAMNGPSSAPSAFPWPSKNGNRGVDAAQSPPSAYVDPAGHIVPVLKIVDADSGRSRMPLISETMAEDPSSVTPTESCPASPRSAEFAMTSFLPPEDADPADAFGMLSPTSTEFAASPWDRDSLLASLGMGSMRQDQEGPRRTVSLRSRGQLQAKPADEPSAPQPTRALRGKISSPTLREQQQLQSLQAKIEATLPSRAAPSPITLSTVDEALMSPRATEFTENPFALSLSVPPSASPKPGEGTVAEDTGAPRSLDSDPRSPPLKGASPITRSIFDFL